MGNDLSRAYTTGLRLVDGSVRPLHEGQELTLAQAFGFDVAGARQNMRCSYLAADFYSDESYRTWPYFRESLALDRLSQAMLTFLWEDRVLLGLCVLQRRTNDPEFTPVDVDCMEFYAPVIAAATRVQMAREMLAREATALRARPIQWRDAEIVALANLEERAVFDTAAYRPYAPATHERERHAELSERERECARLLVAGYSIINVSAMTGLSENTIRTYVRRLYKKLQVSNRADLVREFEASERARHP